MVQISAKSSRFRSVPRCWWCVKDGGVFALLLQMRRREDGAAGTRGGRAGDGGVLVRSRWLPWLTRCGEASRRCRFVVVVRAAGCCAVDGGGTRALVVTRRCRIVVAGNGGGYRGG